MRYPALQDCELLRRYKRFLADVRFPSGEVVTCHCPNTGSMASCWHPRCSAQVSHSNDKRRKYPWTLERTDVGKGWIGVNTHRVNTIVAEGLEDFLLGLGQEARLVQREPRCGIAGYDRSRFDVQLERADGRRLFVEIKNVTLLENGGLWFPDARSERAVKHLALLVRVIERGDAAMLVFALNRPEGSYFAPASRIHPEYAASLRQAVEAGVEVHALRIVHHRDSSHLGSSVPILLDTAQSSQPG